MAERWLTTARRILQHVEGGFDAAGQALPERRYVSPGTPAYDCEQVTVHLVRTYSYEGRVPNEVVSVRGDRDINTLAMRAGQYAITILRCIPTIIPDDMGGYDVPDVDAMERAADLILADAELLPLVVVDLDECGNLSIGPWVAVPPSGGLSGGQITLSLGI